MSKMDDPVVRSLVAARFGLLCNDPWYGALLMRLELIEDNDVEGVQTTYVAIRYNREWIERHTLDQLNDALRAGIDSNVASLTLPAPLGRKAKGRDAFIAAVLKTNLDTGRPQYDRVEHLQEAI